jgi:hypothetical protein
MPDAKDGAGPGAGTPPPPDAAAAAAAEAAAKEAADKAAAAKAAGAGGDTVVGDGKNVVIPSKALKKRLDDSKDRGRKEALAEFQEKIKKAGFQSFDDVLAKLSAPSPKGGERRETRETRETTTSNGEPKPPPGGRNDRRAWARYQRDRAEWDKERQGLARKARQEAEARKRAEREKEGTETEMAIRDACYKAGVKDVPVAVFLLRTELKGKSEEDLKGFDESKWLEQLKTDRPYLFGEAPKVTKPATTGTKGGEQTPPKPGEIAGGGKGNGLDVKKLSGPEFAAEIRRRGMTVPT